MQNLLKYLSAFGPMRVVLLLVVLFCIVIRPELGREAVYTGFGIVTDLLAPVIVPILFMLLMLDAIMGKIYMSDKQDIERHYYRVIVWTNLITGIVLFLYWLPYYIEINS